MESDGVNDLESGSHGSYQDEHSVHSNEHSDKHSDEHSDKHSDKHSDEHSNEHSNEHSVHSNDHSEHSNDHSEQISEPRPGPARATNVAPVSEDIEALLKALQEDTENDTQSGSHKMQKSRFPLNALFDHFGDLNFDDDESTKEEFMTDRFGDELEPDNESKDTLKYLVNVCDDTSDNVTNLMNKVNQLYKDVDMLRQEIKETLKRVQIALE